MRATFYTVDELLPGKPGWSVRQFQSIDDAISHYRTLPMSGNRVLGMVDQENAYELIRCMRIFRSFGKCTLLAVTDFERQKNPLLFGTCLR